MEQVIELISKHGYASVLFGGTILVISFNYKKIIEWLWATIQAAAIIKSHEETIQELKQEVQSLREKLEEYNTILVKQSETIARLEERIIHTAKKRVSDRIEEN